MARLISFFALCSVFALNLNAQKDRKLTAYLQTKQFAAPEIGNYVEIQFQFVGYTINYLPVENGLQGELAVFIDISQYNKVVASDAYRLLTPMMSDSIIDDFYDLKRFALQPGVYDVSLKIQDLNSKHEPVVTNFKTEIESLDDALTISDILIAESALKGNEESPFFKSGYTILPRISTFYPQELENLPAYFEIYNTNELEDSVFGVKQTIINSETGQELEKFTRFSKHTTAPVVPVFREVNIAEVPTGKYILNYMLLDRSMNELSKQSYEFERSNDLQEITNYTDLIIDPAFQASIHDDSVEFYLTSLIPISKATQARTIINEYKGKNSDRQRKLIQAFWKETSGVNMYEAWIKYKTQVQKIEKLYATTFQNGFETDRGRVYLQYGPPTRTVDRETSPSEYPWEAWEYNKIGVFSNKKFIFYNPTLINREYRLLHSDMIGEIKNPRWTYELVKRNTVNGNVDDPNQYNPDSWGNNGQQIIGY